MVCQYCIKYNCRTVSVFTQLFCGAFFVQIIITCEIIMIIIINVFFVGFSW